MPTKRIAAVIPFFNEAQRLPAVFKAMSKLSELEAVIGVNDGSTDNSKSVFQKQFSHLKLVDLAVNSGKTAAIKAGVAHTHAEYILLCDADLQRLSIKELKRAAQLVVKHDLDMLILRRVNTIPSTKLFRGELIYTGERIIKRSILKKVLLGSVVDFQIEGAINHYFMEHPSCRIAWMSWSGLSTYKIIKRGFWRGLLMEAKMNRDMITYGGLGFFMRQYFYSYNIPQLS